MTDLSGDIVNRVRRLPKPSNAAEALQPIFEAVSNAIHAVHDKHGESVDKAGLVQIVINSPRSSDQLQAEIHDNGTGLDSMRFKAFTTTDTPFKIDKGGKGVGRLMWLDAFEKISVDSVFEEEGKLYQRAFKFYLRENNQIDEDDLKALTDDRSTGTSVYFYGLRETSYAKFFPKYPKVAMRHFASHFLANFILGNAPRLELSVDGQEESFPDFVLDLLSEDRGEDVIDTEEYGQLTLSNFIMDKAASAEFDGDHQMHLVASGRTVLSRKVDGLLGLGRMGDNNNYVYHGCLSGEFLDQKVNQERTHFNFSEQVGTDLCRVAADTARGRAICEEVQQFDSERKEAMETFLEEYPSFHFESAESLLKRAPKNATKKEQFAQALIPHRIRRDEERNTQVNKLLNSLASGEEITSDVAKAVRNAADDVKAEEQRQLTEYVLRRKVVLQVLEQLIRRIREKNEDEHDYHLESTLHQFICPMQIRGGDPARVESSEHDLWVIDERLTFAKYFASDVSFRSMIEESKSAERPDVLIYDKLHGLGLQGDEPLTRVMLVEFKKPGRRHYDERYSPMNQILRYLNELAGQEVENFKGQRVRIARDCVFYCYVVADIVGMMKVYTSAWKTTANGRGRWTELSGDFQGSIEVIEWKDLIDDAKLRNRPFIHYAGLRYEDE